MALTSDNTAQYSQHMQDASTFYAKVEWEDMAKSLELAKKCCEQAGFPDKTRSKQKVYEQYGSTLRRFGRFREAATVLEAGLKLAELDESNRTFQEILSDAGPKNTRYWQKQDHTAQPATLEQLALLGELGVTYCHMDDLTSAEQVFNIQFDLASNLASQTPSLQADAEVCRSVGNLGLALYLRALFELGAETSEGQRLLNEAIARNNSRLDRCHLLRAKIGDDPQDRNGRNLKGKLAQWEAIAEARLTVCFVAKKMSSEALLHGQLVVDLCKDLSDSTMRAHARFYLGYALWLDGREAESKAQWEFHSDSYAPDKGTPAIAFSKEPSKEHRYYLEILVGAGVRMDHLDEQGYTALDYAIFSEDEGTKNIIIAGLRGTSHDEAAISAMLRDAHLKRYYRVIFQERFRPAFSGGTDMCIKEAKLVYAQLRAEDQHLASTLDGLRFVNYTAFKSLGGLPKRGDQSIAVDFTIDNADREIVFLSYRWIGGTMQGGNTSPDDDNNTQYKRMCAALEQLVTLESIKEQELGVWLDVACIDQSNKGPGIAALPLAIAQCHYMICLVDGDKNGYSARAWCCSEVLMMETLEKSYRRHKRFEHVLRNERSSIIDGRLGLAPHVDGKPKPSEQNLSYEADREQIRFLERQARFLGN